MKGKSNLQTKEFPEDIKEIASAALLEAIAEYSGMDVPDLATLRVKAGEQGVYLKVIRNSLARRALQTRTEGFDHAFDSFGKHALLRDPFWHQQFALKKAQRDHILESYNLVSADNLKKDCFPGWGASDPVSALNKRAERNQVLSIVEDGQRLYPIEQFEYKADSPKLSTAFSKIMKAFANNGEISQEEILYWLCTKQPLLLPSESQVNEAIDTNSLEQGWEALKAVGPTKDPLIRPLDCLVQGDSDTALRLFYDWTEIEQDGPAHNREEVIDAVRNFMAIERISIDDLSQG